jgi:sugar phosphate permease
MWYKRSEGQKRYSFFFSSTTLAGAFGGLVASGIGKMDGKRGIEAWRWIFILEGVLTCVIAIALFFTLPDFPETARWVTEDERRYVQARLRIDQGRSAADRKITMKDVVRFYKDPMTFIGGLMYFGMVMPAYSKLSPQSCYSVITTDAHGVGYAYFSPSIIRTYGYSPIQTQLYSVPPWAAAFGFSMTVAYLSDRLRHRFLFTVVPICVAITGCSILLAVHNNRNVQYGALFLVAMGTYSAMPVIICWYSMNLGGHHRRAIGTAWQLGFGNIGGIIATYSFLAKDAPRYTPGYSICVTWLALSVICCTLYFVAIWRQNRSRDRDEKNTNLTEAEKEELGDLSPDYRYLL